MYADKITESMRKAIGETMRRRGIQAEYNEKHGIVPKTIRKEVRELLEISKDAEVSGEKTKNLSARERAELIAKLERDMKEAARMMEFEYAALLRDRIIGCAVKNKESESMKQVS